MLGLRTYQFQLGDYKTIMDKDGRQASATPIIHGYAYQTSTLGVAGRSRVLRLRAGVLERRDVPAVGRLSSRSTDYWARGSLVLQSGKPRTDVAIYRDGFLTTAALGFGRSGAIKELFDAVAMEKAGYSLQYLDPNGVIDPAADGTGVLYPDGPRYRAWSWTNARCRPPWRSSWRTRRHGSRRGAGR